MQSQRLDPGMEISLSSEYIEDLDTEKLKELYLKASYILSLTLCQSVGRTHTRLGVLSQFLESMEDSLFASDFNSLSLDDQLKLYTAISNSSTRVFDNIIKLNASMATNIDAVAKIEDSKNKYAQARKVDKKDPKIKDILSELQKEQERRKSRTENNGNSVINVQIEEN